MKKTLILVVDRDDDFGTKGGIDTPVIGVKDCSIAASLLGVADPEDSDTNALYAAINIYKEMLDEGNTNVEVALICGNEKVGYKSDSAIVDELEIIIEKVAPDRVILVGDGAEDEYVYPIVSSRIPIDSVKKVFVRQAPGIEGTFYIISKYMEDPQKRIRFLAPLSWLLILISLLYVIPAIMDYYSNGDSLKSATSPAIVLIIGLMLGLYAYNIPEKFHRMTSEMGRKIKHGSLSVTFFLLSVLMIITGIVAGYYAVSNTYTTNLAQDIFWFTSNSMWLFLFAFLVYMFGDLVDGYLENHQIKLSFIVASINIVAIGLLLTALNDVILAYIGIGLYSVSACVIEFCGGMILAFTSSYVQRYIKAAIVNVEGEGDAVS